MKNLTDVFLDSARKIQFIRFKRMPTDTVNYNESVKKFRDAFFNQIVISKDLSNDEKISRLKNIDLNAPILYYSNISNGELVENFIKRKYYNQYHLYEISGDKYKFHKLFNNKPFIPTTKFSIRDLNNSDFPLVAKPANGRSGLGIEVFNDKKSLMNSTSTFDIFTKKVEIKREFRALCFKNKIILLNERVSSNSISSKKPNEQLKFEYIPQDKGKIYFMDKLNSIQKECYKLLPLDVYSIDFALTDDNEIQVFEINGNSGLGLLSLICLYRAIHCDFYGFDINEKINKYLLDLAQNELKPDVKTLEPMTCFKW